MHLSSAFFQYTDFVNHTRLLPFMVINVTVLKPITKSSSVTNLIESSNSRSNLGKIKENNKNQRVNYNELNL